MSSILDDTKKALGLEADYDVFDLDIIMHINSVFSTLEQLGIGPDGGFAITDSSAQWDTFLAGDPRLNSVKSYMFLKVSLMFDPPSTSYLITARQEQAKEFEWRLSTYRETTLAGAPGTAIDGGTSA